MDWKNNQMVGVGAAVVLILVIVGWFVLTNNGQSGNGASQGGQVYTFLCKSTNETFTIPQEQAATPKYEEYMSPAGTEVTCVKCGKKDAVAAYYCKTCKKYYPVEPGSEMLMRTTCPLGHDADADPDAKPTPAKAGQNGAK